MRRTVSLTLLLLVVLAVGAEAQMESKQRAVQPLWADAWIWSNVGIDARVTFRFSPPVELVHFTTQRGCSLRVWNSDADRPAPTNWLAYSQPVSASIAVSDCDSIRVHNYSANTNFVTMIGDKR